jgi:hypothetical protein
MTCALATAAVAVALAGPMCPRADATVPADVMAALRGVPLAGEADTSGLRAAVLALTPTTPNRRRRR